MEKISKQNVGLLLLIVTLMQVHHEKEYVGPKEIRNIQFVGEKKISKKLNVVTAKACAGREAIVVEISISKELFALCCVEQ